MTKRNPVSAQQNIWNNGQVVDDDDLSLEQQFNNTIQSSIISNHIGAGALPDDLLQNILFDSSLATGFLDGVAVFTQNQPSDNNFGNQLEIELSNSKAAGRKVIKIAIIGLDFQSNLQYETFVFKTNETQVSFKHFSKILLILFNDFIGDPNLSLNLGGKIVIREVKPLTLSRDAIMVSQDIEPNLFFRDFFVNANNTSLSMFLQAALPIYNIDSLNISTDVKDQKLLLNGDVTTQIGQKFKASTNNIQKISLLLSVENQDIGHTADLVWNGDLVVSIYPLQSNVTSPSDLVPNLPIEFPPNNIPIAQISFNYSSLQDNGVVLDSVPQPVDFIFSNSPIASGNILIPGNYYALTIKRSGAANKCDILVAAGGDQTPDSRITVFTGDLWVDIPEQDLWFRVWTDSAKLSDGQGYESGFGIIVPKTTLDEISGATIDHSLDHLQFSGNDVFKAVISASTQETTPVEDQRTGEPILSRKQFVPQVELLNSLDITSLEKASDPLLAGAIVDKNRKFFDSISSLINSKLYSATMAEDELLIKIIDDPTDTTRFDTSVNSLVTNLLNGDFVGAKIIPNNNSNSIFYKIAEARLCSMMVGDVDGNGIIDVNDLTLLNTYLGYNLNTGLPLNSTITTNGVTTTAVNGYTTYIAPFSNLSNIEFQVVNSSTNAVVASGLDGILVANPNDPRLAQFTSATVNFNSITGLSSFKLVMFNNFNPEDKGIFDIISLDTTLNVITIRKILLNGDTIGQMLRADIDGDFMITALDGYLLQSYIDRVVDPIFTPTSFPAPTTNPFNKIGTRFNILRFKLEKFVDRFDDSTNVRVGRSTALHPSPDIFAEDGYFFNHDFYSSPVPIVFQKQLSWDNSLVVTSSQIKQVPSIFTTQNGFIVNKCELDGIVCEVYEEPPDFDPGKVDAFIPNNLIIGNGGEIVNPDGSNYKVDFEIGTIVLEIPAASFTSERFINIFTDFVADFNQSGLTRLGFPAMKFADCSRVEMNALLNNQVRFSVAVQSFSPNIDGIDSSGITGAIVDGKIGVNMDYASGILALDFTNLLQDIILQTANTKIQITVLLKKAGFNNIPLFVDSEKTFNMLELTGPPSITSTPNFISPIGTVTTIQTSVFTAAFGQIVRCNPSGGGFAVNLPSAVGNAGKQIIVKNISSSSNSITITPNGTETIDSFPNLIINIGFHSATIISDGTNWMRINF